MVQIGAKWCPPNIYNYVVKWLIVLRMTMTQSWVPVNDSIEMVRFVAESATTASKHMFLTIMNRSHHRLVEDKNGTKCCTRMTLVVMR